MLSSLTIQNVVLIDRLQLEGDPGLSVLTGETGAGKSILLDALGLALGARADSSLVRNGESQATVTVQFDVPAKHPVRDLLKEKDITIEQELILRRTVSRDGRSKAFLNDAPISLQLLKDISAELVEIHGQFETHGLLDAANHRQILDSYAGLSTDLTALQTVWKNWNTATRQLRDIASNIAVMQAQEEYLSYAVRELEKLAPAPGEESILAEKRHYLLNIEKTREGFEQALEILTNENGLQSLTGRLESTLDRLASKAGDMLRPAVDTLSRIKVDIEELSDQIDRLHSGKDRPAEKLEDIEERYFALKECAKKHRCTVDDLPQLLHDMSQKLSLIQHPEDALKKLTAEEKAARAAYTAQAEKISQKRQKAAAKLSKAVQNELPDLKLDKARFVVDIHREENPEQWGATGFDRVQFLISTNAGTPPAPLHKTASGGELSRFMLALKLILAETSSILTLIFDEVDSGIGGATADAVGERLARLARQYQVLVVTHSPQVAARGQHHWHVAKTGQKGTVVTRITPLTQLKDREEEIARMLAGATVTKEARAAAAKLLENQDAAA